MIFHMPLPDGSYQASGNFLTEAIFTLTGTPCADFPADRDNELRVLGRDIYGS